MFSVVKNKRKESVISGFMKNKEGMILMKPEEIRNRWKEYFHDLLNVRNTMYTEDTEVPEEEEVDADIKMAEVELAIKKTKMGKP